MLDFVLVTNLHIIIIIIIIITTTTTTTTTTIIIIIIIITNYFLRSVQIYLKPVNHHQFPPSEFEEMHQSSAVATHTPNKIPIWKHPFVTYSGVETGGSDGSMNRGPRTPGSPRVRGQNILRKKRIGHF